MNEYNGYPNYPTWNVSLWFSNDEGSYLHMQELTAEAIRDNAQTVYEDDYDEEGTLVLDRDAAVADLAEALEAWADELTPDLEGFVADIFGWAFKHVDWRHLAENQIGESDAAEGLL